MSVDLKAVALALALPLASCATTSPEPAATPPAPVAPPPRPFVECKLTHRDGGTPAPVRAVSNAMQAIKSKVGGCFDRYKQPGTAGLAIEVSADGTLESVGIYGDLGDSDEAHCIEDVARSLQLPITGDPYSLCYPFTMR
jgi:hypothetical protein